MLLGVCVCLSVCSPLFFSLSPFLLTLLNNYKDDWYGQFLSSLSTLAPSALPDVVTHHLYSLGPGVSTNAWQAALNVTIMDQVHALGRQIQKTVQAASPKSAIWMGEGGGCYNSGSNNVTNAFNSGFWYLDQMGSFAATGHGAFCRQTLAGGYYGLLDTDSRGNVIRPNPDYYSLLLWSRLMGQSVLQATSADQQTLRVYAHCTSPDAPGYSAGAITLLLINLSNSTAAQPGQLTTTEQANLLSLPREEYILSSACGDTDTADERVLLACREMLLNGRLLALTPDGQIPPLEAQLVNAGVPLVINPLSYAFVVFPSANAASCL